MSLIAHHIVRSLRRLLSGPMPVLFALTVIGGVLRFYNLNWDQGHSFHPDERNISAAVSRIHFFDDLDPEFFAYGSFLIYLYRSAGELVSAMTGDPAWISAWGNINLVGRNFSAVFATLAIPATYHLTRRLFSSVRMALAATLITAFSASLIQTAHFAITESLLVLLAILVASLSYRILIRPRLSSFLACGLVIGAAVATKMSAASFFVFPFSAAILFLLKKPRSFSRIANTTLLVVDLVAVAFLTLVVLAPFTFLRWEKFLESMRYESGVAMGRFSVPYTLQFSHTIPYLYQLVNLVWQLGPVALFSLTGFLALPWLVGRRQIEQAVLLFSFPLVYFIAVGSWYTKFIRFMVPILPFFTLIACLLFEGLMKKWRRLGGAIAVGAILSTVLWGIGFFSIYTREQTRISASTWIYEHVPEGSLVLREHWDDGLPLPLISDTPESHGYRLESLTIYEPDSDGKLTYYADRLSAGDYLVLSSRRLYGTLIHLEDQYPLTSRYYRMLFAGRLGYVKVAEFRSYPSFAGISIKDDTSEETFQVYDHPTVMVFANSKRYSDSQLSALLEEQ